MSYKVLARKWRPQLFQDVIGQEHITQTLINAIKKDRVAHAYLFGGPRGVGKTSVARILAKAINCQEGKDGIPCNVCRSCVEITESISVDVQEIDGASNRGIDEIRELRENAKYMPSTSRYRIYIIDEIHMLTKEAFNALLKTLEEPPTHVKFIFATTEASRVPVTILSRCQRFDFRRIPPGLIISYLERITKEEGIRVSKSGLALIARESEGSMRDAEGLLDQVVSFTGADVEDRYITEILGIIDREIIFEASQAIIEGSSKKCMEIVDQVYNYGYDIKSFYRLLMAQFRNLLISLIAPEDGLLDMNKTETEEAAVQAGKAGLEKLQVALNFLINREQDLRFSSHPRLVLETIMIKLCNLGEFLSFGDIINKIDSLEKRLGGKSTSDKQQTSEYSLEEMTSEFFIKEPRFNSDKKDLEHNIKGSVVQGKAEQTGKGWDEFLKFLSVNNSVFCSILKDYSLLRLNGEIIEIAKGKQSFASSYFDDKDRYEQLSAYCREFFQRDMRVLITSGSLPGTRTEQPRDVKNDDSRNMRKKDVVEPAQNILDIFKGEIVQNYPADESGAHDLEEEKDGR